MTVNRIDHVDLYRECQRGIKSIFANDPIACGQQLRLLDLAFAIGDDEREAKIMKSRGGKGMG